MLEFTCQITEEFGNKILFPRFWYSFIWIWGQCKISCFQTSYQLITKLHTFPNAYVDWIEIFCYALFLNSESKLNLIISFCEVGKCFPKCLKKLIKFADVSVYVSECSSSHIMTHLSLDIWQYNATVYYSIAEKACCSIAEYISWHKDRF